MTELSPEEKRRIYLEEKERLEAQEKIKKEKQAIQAKKVNGCLLGCLIPILVIFFIIILLMTCEKGKKYSSYTSTHSTSSSEYDRILDDYHRKGEFLGYKTGEGGKWARDVIDSHDATERIKERGY